MKMQRTDGLLRIVFLVLNASVLEPDLDLLLGQLQCVRNFDASQSGEILAGCEFPFQFQKLCAGEGSSDSFAGFVDIADGSRWRKRSQMLVGAFLGGS